MSTQDNIYNHYILPFNIVESMGLKCGYEKSFKLTEGNLLRNRYLLGIEMADLDETTITTICSKMGMPDNYYSDFTGNIEGANLILLGYEESGNDCVYKIYLEYWDQVRKQLKKMREPYRPLDLFIGYKWSALNNKNSTVTKYRYLPMLTTEQILTRMRKLYKPDGGDVSFNGAKDIVTYTARYMDSSAFRYLEAEEKGNPRSSFDMNLYSAGIKLKELYPMLEKLCLHYSISAGELRDLLYQVGTSIVGHISGGTGRHGESFLTVYYDMEKAH